ncbi:MAG: hypothetical protein MZV70_30295 [Desulfobacterales bacterium]|nr:hypothetical protein [Desulfobacterales bacterium]
MPAYAGVECCPVYDCCMNEKRSRTAVNARTWCASGRGGQHRAPHPDYLSGTLLLSGHSRCLSRGGIRVTIRGTGGHRLASSFGWVDPMFQKTPPLTMAQVADAVAGQKPG